MPVAQLRTMALYLSSEVLEEAVERLGKCRAHRGLGDFLIVKRAMAQGGSPVKVVPSDKHFMAAINQIALATNDTSISVPQPFFNPFGSSREIKRGWRTKKYPSNGTCDTVTGPKWTDVFEVVSHGPREVEFQDDYVEHLQGVVMTGSGPYPKPFDIAAWFFRFDDVEAIVGSSPTEEDLVAAFEEAVGLTDDEKDVIYGPPPVEDADESGDGEAETEGGGHEDAQEEVQE
jgi:hypothetical protein